MSENGPDQAGLTWQAKEELIRSYTEKEQDLQMQLDRKEKLIEDLRRKLRALKRYTRQLKYLAEDWAPLGQPLPEILTMPPPVSLEDDEDDDYLRRQQNEIDRLKNKNRNLEEDLRRQDKHQETRGFQASVPNNDRYQQTSHYGGSNYNQQVQTSDIEVEKMRKKIESLEFELNNQKQVYVKKNSEKNMSKKNESELDTLRMYIKQLEDEIASLKIQLANKQVIRGPKSQHSMHSAGVQKVDDVQERILQELSYLKGNQEVLNRPGTSSVEVDRLRKERDALIDENKKLKALLNEDSAAPSSGNVKYLKNKIFHLEKTLAQLEKERSELSVRTTMAEEQLKNLQEHLQTNTHSYQKKIFDMKKILKSKGVDVSVF